MKTTRPAAVAGLFYPADATQLTKLVTTLLENAAPKSAAPPPKALIAPHAGYIYSGPIAASAYAPLKAAADRIKRVILLGPVHRVPVRGLALPGSESFATPLGIVPVDIQAVAAIRHLPQVVTSARAHAEEHSLEVHLPFLQRILKDFTLLPLAVGDATAEEVAEVLNLLWGGPETLIVISSDLSHYLPYALARVMDADTSAAITALTQRPIHHEQACGGTPINGLLLAARQHGLQPRLLDLRNSGDTAGDRDRVVGYGAFAFTEGVNP
jgi:AmmeMemoRadiSam system protein B